MPNTLEHGQARAGLVTASVAHIVMHGSMKAWETLRLQLWADDGSQFAKEATGARRHGHEMEAVTAGAFWDRHPEFEIEPVGFLPYAGRNGSFIGRVGCSPDRIIRLNGRKHAGLECKSPTTDDNFQIHQVDPERFRSSKHYDQIQHSMFSTGLTRWWLAIHAGIGGDGLYTDFEFRQDKAWVSRYTARLLSFLEFMEGESVTMRRKSARDIL